MHLVSVFVLITYLLHAVEGSIEHVRTAAAHFERVTKLALANCPGKLDKRLLYLFAEDHFEGWGSRQLSTKMFDENNLACQADFFCKRNLKTYRDVGKAYSSAGKACGESQLVSALAGESIGSDEVLPESDEVISENFYHKKEDLDGREVLLSMTKGNLVSFLFGLLSGFLINYLYRSTLSPTTNVKVLRRPEL